MVRMTTSCTNSGAVFQASFKVGMLNLNDVIKGWNGFMFIMVAVGLAFVFRMLFVLVGGKPAGRRFIPPYPPFLVSRLAKTRYISAGVASFSGWVVWLPWQHPGRGRCSHPENDARPAEICAQTVCSGVIRLRRLDFFGFCFVFSTGTLF